MLGLPVSTVAGSCAARARPARPTDPEPGSCATSARARAASSISTPRSWAASWASATAPPGSARAQAGVGWEVLHVAIDDATRLVYAEILPDERRTTPRLRERALRWFASGASGVAGPHRQRLGLPQPRLPPARRRLGIKHKRTRPYSAPDQRQGRALHPDHPARVGLPARSSRAPPKQRRLAPVDRPLQPQPTRFSPRRKNLLGNDN